MLTPRLLVMILTALLVSLPIHVEGQGLLLIQNSHFFVRINQSTSLPATQRSKR